MGDVVEVDGQRYMACWAAEMTPTCPHPRWTRARLGYAPKDGPDRWRCDKCGEIREGDAR
jgi:hypothetical protein